MSEAERRTPRPPAGAAALCSITECDYGVQVVAPAAGMHLSSTRDASVGES